jgi:hypothetical protein
MGDEVRLRVDSSGYILGLLFFKNMGPFAGLPAIVPMRDVIGRDSAE